MAQMTIDHDEVSAIWNLHVNGSFGTGTKITSMQLFGTNANGTRLSDPQPLDPARIPVTSPFAETFPILKPDPRWEETGLELTLSDGQASAVIQSALFPIIWRHPVLIDHAIHGSVIAAPNYEAGGIPDGIGISHALLNGIPEGDYFAVVFFEGMHGCPSGNYHVSAFIPNKLVGEDERPLGPYIYTADSTTGGGCMQEFHIDSAKGSEWLWGALSNTGTSSAIADADGIPAFAICATAAACDPIRPHGEIAAPEDGSATITPAVSDVLFLPGIKGSELYEDNPLCLIPSDNCGIKVWLPLADLSVPELFLDAEGKSKKSIFVRKGALLGSVLNQSFYDSFTSALDSARDAGTFGAGWNWKAISYDWRLSLPDIVQGGVARGSHIHFDGTAGTGAAESYLKQELRSLASSSPTGKVTIVAHSNGGLVAKALMQSLGDTLSAQLIDSVIFVGVPQSGAPRAVGALLYGDAEGIPGIPHVPNVIMSAAHAREFGLNSPMAYHLLPSARYMSALQPEHPVLRFEGKRGISTEAELKSFALAEDGSRSMPKTTDLTAPNVLNSSLYAYAESEHAVLDAWQPPRGIEVYELGGYDANTISGLDLYTSTHKDGSASLSYRPLFTSEGDGTVPLISALMMNAAAHVHPIWLDLASMRGNIGYSHANLLEAPDVQVTIEDILHGTAAYPASVHDMGIPPLISRKQFGFYVHSPVSLTIVDAEGARTSVTESGTEEHIPGSTAGMLGEVKYVLVPAEEPYTVLLEGEDEGTFTLDMQALDNGAITASSTIADVPVHNGMKGTLTIGEGLASASALAIDEDADGSPDLFVQPVLGTTVFPNTTTTSVTIQIPPEHGSKEINRPLLPLATSTISSIVASTSVLVKDAGAVLKSAVHPSMKPSVASIPQVMGSTSLTEDRPVTQSRAGVLVRLTALLHAVLQRLLRLIAGL